jgi:hypothetical protein
MTNNGLCAAFLALLLASCTLDDKGVDYRLRGSWECMAANPWTGEKSLLVLDHDTITITGSVAHLRGFTRGIALEAYTKDGEPGLLYIKDRGILQSPVAYRRWQSGSTPKLEMLTLTGGGAADETFKKVEESTTPP